MITIAGEIHSSKNSRRVVSRGKRVIVLKSKAAQADEDMLSLQLASQRENWDKMKSTRDFPLYVVFSFRRRTHARWDFANLVQGVADAMTKAGYIPDDDVEHFIPVYGGYDVCKDNPGVDFWIE